MSSEHVEVLRDLAECCRAAIKAGDWKVDGACDPESLLRHADAAIAALSANQPEGDVVVTRNDGGEIVAVTRQDAEGRILSVIAEAAPEPPAEAQQPASDGGFTAADMMDARQEGRKEAEARAERLAEALRAVVADMREWGEPAKGAHVERIQRRLDDALRDHD